MGGLRRTNFPPQTNESDKMRRVQTVAIAPAPPGRLRTVLRPDRAELWLALTARAKNALENRTIWNLSSTAGGGGVAEMLHGFLRYVRGDAVDVRWMVIDGSPEFFDVTKRVHNFIHGDPGDGGVLDVGVYEDVLASSASELRPLIQRDDVVILHDPQTAGLAPALRGSGATLIWRSHVGTEVTNEWTEKAWAFLQPYVMAADSAVFSRQAYVPGWLPADRTAIIPPSIDPLSTKNRKLPPELVLAILGRAGLLQSDGGDATFLDGYARERVVTDRVAVVREGGPLGPDVPIVLQVSRWDRLKDMPGVLRGFVQGDVGTRTGAHLLLVGPDVAAVRDDPEGRGVLAACTEYWHTLPRDQRATVSLVSVPMNDLEQNAAIINAVQRHARIVAQKSLKEGFGLTVSEGMWKGAPVVASAVGGLQDQVRDGVDGFLLEDPNDLTTFGAVLTRLLTDHDLAGRMGRAGRERVRDHFLADRDLSDWFLLIERLLDNS